MNHKEKIYKIVNFLKNRKKNNPIKFIKKSVSHQVPKPGKSKQPKESIDLSNLNQILKIDKEKKICIAEPGVTFSDLVKETLKYNLTPIIVPELKTITIGGAVAGCSIEAASYKYGGFHDTCLEYEIITAKGDIITATPDNENKDIFEMVHGTFGTLGIISKLTFKLAPAKSYVHLKYKTYQTLEDYKKAIWDNYIKKDNDFIDGIIHSPEKFILILGNFVEKAPYTNSYTWMKIFYKSTLKRKEDYLSTYEYFFRYDAECHWISRNYGLENPILRFLFGKIFLSSTRMLKMAKKLGFFFKKRKPEVVVDVFVPYSKMEKFFSFYLKEFNFFPLWMVPYKIEKPYKWINEKHLQGVDDKLFIDFAIYGMKQKEDKNYYRIMEEELMKLHGLKTLISHNYYSEKEFWQIWNKDNYNKVKTLIDPDNIFQNIYKKTHQKN